MQKNRGKVALFGAVFVLVLGLLAGCGATQKKTTGTTGTATGGTIRIGTLQTDDLLPLWVAEKEGLFKRAGLNVKIITFQSAQEQVAAMTSGNIDGMMTDMVVPLQLTAGGTAMRAVTRLQGAPAGIVAGKGSGITKVGDLAGVKTGCSSPTVMEYLYDTALSDAGVPKTKIVTEEIKKLPVRFEMLNAGKIKAAMLPWTFYTLAVKQGGTPVLDEKQASAYTSTVLEFSEKYLTTAGAGAQMKKLLACWNAGVAKVNAQPQAYRALLAEKANLPAPLRATYQVRMYPQAGAPDRAQFDAVATWMVEKGYLKTKPAYDTLVYAAK